MADSRGNQQHHVHPVPGRDVLDWVWWAHRSPILLLAQIVAHNIINLDFLASKLIRNFPSRLYELSLQWDWLQLCGVCVFYCRCCKFDQLLIVHWRNIFVYSRWRESKRCLLLGLTSLAENVLELPELSMLQDIGWRSTDPCPHRFSQSMTVDTPASGIESLLPPSGTSYKSVHRQHTPTKKIWLIMKTSQKCSTSKAWHGAD